MTEKIKYNELVEKNIKIEKKFILIDSRNYTSKAYEYLLSLVDESESVAFISDTRKIYTQGQYFGGDLWKETLYYFSGVEILNETDEIVSAMNLDKGDSKLQIKGENGLILRIDTEDTPEGTKNVLVIGYNLEAGIDSTPIKINPEYEYNLGVENGKIKLQEYIPLNIIPQEVDNFELDSFEEATVEYRFLVIGNDDNKEFKVIDQSTLTEIPYSFSNNILKFSSKIYKNANQEFEIQYSDSRNSKSYLFTQKWSGYYFYSTNEIVEETRNTAERYIPYENETIAGEFILTQQEDEYGYFACPLELANSFFFKDWSNGLAGGWKKVGVVYLYSDVLPYMLFKTSQSGLGKIKWILEKQLA